MISVFKCRDLNIPRKLREKRIVDRLGRTCKQARNGAERRLGRLGLRLALPLESHRMDIRRIATAADNFPDPVLYLRPRHVRPLHVNDS